MGSRRSIPSGMNCANGMSKRRRAPKRKIVAVAHDIGGAQAVYPLIPKLRSRSNLHVDVIAGGFAQRVFARLHPENTAADWSEGKVDEYLDKYQPQLVLSGTSWKSCLEQNFRNRARARDIPSVVVIDFWSDHPRRWHHSAYRFEESHDVVCVPDKPSAEAMVSYGYPGELVRVTGHPHLERCFQRVPQSQARSVGRKEIEVLFLTIALAALKLKEDTVAQTRIVCQALGQWSAAIKKPIRLTIRPHPHEAPEPDFLRQVSKFAPTGVAVRMADRTKPILAQLRRSDLVLGHITMGLFEARSLGKRAVALKVTEHPSELVAAMEDAGIPLLPFEADRIASHLRSQRHIAPDRIGNLHHGAAAAIASLCCELIATKA